MYVRLFPMRLLRIPEPFDHPDCLFEIKLDGFRALAHVRRNRCSLVSRNDHVFKSWPELGRHIASEVQARSAVLDGEICCLGPDGSTQFYDLMFRRSAPYFCVFDVLAIDGKDLTRLPLVERKARLRSIIPVDGGWLRYLDAFPQRGIELYRTACERDLEGVVAKWRHGTYQCDGRTTSWMKIKNPEYSQAEGRPDLFNARRDHGHKPSQRTIAPDLQFAKTYRFLQDIQRLHEAKGRRS